MAGMRKLDANYSKQVDNSRYIVCDRLLTYMLQRSSLKYGC